MFTGIIQNQGSVKNKVLKNGQVHFIFGWKKPFKNLQLGESIAVNGVCLTVAKFSKTSFEVDVIKETLEATNLGELHQGSVVNLERSLKWGDSMGGHFVSGHVDAFGILKSILRRGKNITFVIAYPEPLDPFIVRKGSIAIDGVSLTIQSVQKNNFTVGLVPHTLKETNLGVKKIGSKLNLEIDLMFRYLLNLKKKHGLQLKDFWEQSSFGGKSSTRIHLKTLKKQGF